MSRTMHLKEFSPYEKLPEDERKQLEGAKMARPNSKAFKGIQLALRDCGVTPWEAAERLNSFGTGAHYTMSYTKSAQFAPSYYAPQGYGAFGMSESVKDHLEAIKAYYRKSDLPEEDQGKDPDAEAQYFWDSLPDSHQHEDTEVLVIYAYAHNGKAYRGSDKPMENLPSSKDDVLQRRAQLGGSKKGRQSKKKKTTASQ